MAEACYRKLHKYKYQLVDSFAHGVAIHQYDIKTPYLTLSADGLLTVNKGYAWDGPSGPTIDTLNFMRGSLVHDALYQLIRMEKIAHSYKDYADRLLQSICRDDGMSQFRAWYVYQAVKYFSGSSAEPGTQQPDEIICVPPEKS